MALLFSKGNNFHDFLFASLDHDIIKVKVSQSLISIRTVWVRNPFYHDERWSPFPQLLLSYPSLIQKGTIYSWADRVFQSSVGWQNLGAISSY